MDHLQTTDSIFFENAALDRDRAEAIVRDALVDADDGELFLEMRHSEMLMFDDGRLKSASYDQTSGFGLRAIADEAHGYAHAGDISEAALQRAAESVTAVTRGYSGTAAQPPVSASNRPLYSDGNPLTGTPFEDKVALLQEIDAFARAADPRVVQVSASLAGSWQAVQIIRADGHRAADIRPLVRLNVSVVVSRDGRMESGSSGAGGRVMFDNYMAPEIWQAQVREALRIATLNLDSVAAPAGEMEVALGAGWPGVMLHEAVGHGLEGDFNRKGTSIFSGRVGKQVAAKGVTVVDDGTMQDRRGSITIDDEGTQSRRNVLIEDGILRGYMQDRQNARLMGVEATGNGRRQSHEHAPMPRMTNTFMENGPHSPEEIVSSMKKGIYAVNFGGGQVDITSGKFVFAASEAYLVENGKIGAPVKGATLIGNGPDAMSKISMVGNDMALDDGVGTCGKAGQSVPVGVGQPTVKMGGITVGGTEAA
ncbi:MAG: metalloprotease TldD [Pseudomonadota bacterium]|nr:metalloprotease TldD [Pseudomonadota bacterium]MEC7437658.1 metalloprotease TldD [Pseudomonadota bacterium]MEC7485437.1 metalloprotease TldD [Pseudomonadota bacterium]MEC7495927.1 metalloprotease TldD [Pseudomonadota bacterium]MEC7982222.1 metalloprotease TldD [Pseudomonadota bacterium]